MRRSHKTQQNTTFFEHAQTITVVTGLLICCALFFGTAYSPSIQQFFSKQPAQIEQPTQSVNRLDEGGTDSGQIRLIVWRGALDVWKRYPILGSGVETFAYSYYKDRPAGHNMVSEWDFLYNKAHNEFLNFLATTGVVGLLSYVTMLATFILFPLWTILQTKNLSSDRVLLLSAVSAGLVSLTVSNFFGFSTVMVGVLFFVFPAIAWHLSEGSETLEERQSAHGSNTGQVLNSRQAIWSGVVALTVLILFIFIWRTWRADYFFAQGKRLTQQQQYSDSIEDLEKAYDLSNGEGIFAEELAEMYSWLSSGFFTNQQATAAAAFKEAALIKTEEMIAENPYNLNFYKTKARVLATLSQQEPGALAEAQRALEHAVELAPTDPRVRYNLGLVKLSQSATAAAQADIEQSIQMRPAFEDPRMSLAELFTTQAKYQEAIDQYRYILEYIQPRNEVAKSEIARLEVMIASQSAKTKVAPVRR